MEQLDLLSQKVAKALYMMQSLKAENLSLKENVDNLSSKNLELIEALAEKEQHLESRELEVLTLQEQASANENAMEEASSRLDGMLSSLEQIDFVIPEESDHAEPQSAEEFEGEDTKWEGQEVMSNEDDNQEGQAEDSEEVPLFVEKDEPVVVDYSNDQNPLF
jgi:hypothetical protein